MYNIAKGVKMAIFRLHLLASNLVHHTSYVAVDEAHLLSVKLIHSALKLGAHLPKLPSLSVQLLLFRI